MGMYFSLTTHLTEGDGSFLDWQCFSARPSIQAERFSYFSCHSLLSAGNLLPYQRNTNSTPCTQASHMAKVSEKRHFCFHHSQKNHTKLYFCIQWGCLQHPVFHAQPQPPQGCCSSSKGLQRIKLPVCWITAIKIIT